MQQNNSRPDPEYYERLVLGEIMYSEKEEQSELLAMLHPGDFGKQKWRKLFSAFKEINQQGMKIDTPSIYEYDKTLLPLEELATLDRDVRTNANVKHHIYALREFRHKRSMLEMRDLMNRELTEDATYDDEVALKGKLIKMVGDIDNYAGRVEFNINNTAASYLPTLYAEAQRRTIRGRKYRFCGLDFGFNYWIRSQVTFKYRISHLNLIFNGLNPELYIITGGTAVGKTTFCVQLMDEIIMWNNLVAREEFVDKKGIQRSKPQQYIGEPLLDLMNPRNTVACLYFSYEQGINEIMFKSLSRCSKTNNGAIYRGILDPERLCKLDDGTPLMRAIGQSKYIVEATNADTVEQVERIATRIRDSKLFDNVVIFIDYLQILPPSETMKGLYDNRSLVEYNIKELRRLARKEGFPIIAISSIARGQENKTGTGKGKESGLIEYTADAQLNLDYMDPAACSDLYSKDGRRNEHESVIRCEVAKNRNGQKDTFYFLANYSLASFREMYDETKDKKNIKDYELEDMYGERETT